MKLVKNGYFKLSESPNDQDDKISILGTTKDERAEQDE